MRIISWNCNGKFRDKYAYIQKFDADLLVIQECENPSTRGTEDYRHFASNSLWIGENQNKGLGIFAKEGITLQSNNWPAYCLRYFLSVRVNDLFDLLGVWACKPYISEYYIYQSINLSQYSSNTIIMGDFNSNAIWDSQNKPRNHSTVVQELSNVGLASAYHLTTNEQQGNESHPTYYQYRNRQKGYHIDHCFAAPHLISDYQILFEADTLLYSDHVPICLTI